MLKCASPADRLQVPHFKQITKHSCPKPTGQTSPDKPIQPANDMVRDSRAHNTHACNSDCMHHSRRGVAAHGAELAGCRAL